MPENLSHEKETKKELLPITAEEILNLLSSSLFLSLFQKSAKIAQQKGYEAGFSIMTDTYNHSRMYDTGIKASGHSAQIEGGLDLERKTRQEMAEQGLTPIVLVDFHFHPEVAGTELIIPSIAPGDLASSTDAKFTKSGDRSIISRPISLIGQVDREGNATCLAMQEKFLKSLLNMPGTIELLRDEFREARSQNDVIDALRSCNYQAEIINILKDGTISPEDQQRIASFAFQPTISAHKPFGPYDGSSEDYEDYKDDDIQI